jgi:hypothetical protein
LYVRKGERQRAEDEAPEKKPREKKTGVSIEGAEIRGKAEKRTKTI